MKKISFIIFLFVGVFGFNQKLSLDEIVVSSNYSDSNFLNEFTPRFGFGFEIHHTFRKEKTTNFIIGIGYNNQNYKNVNFSPSFKENVKDVSVNSHSLVLPLIFRINLNKRFFIKTGAVINCMIYLKEKGTITYVYPIYKTEQVSQNYSGFLPTPGALLGTGVNYKFFNHQLFTAFNYTFFYNFGMYAMPVSSFNLSLGIKI
jgi:hypothetical protein